MTDISAIGPKEF